MSDICDIEKRLSAVEDKLGMIQPTVTLQEVVNDLADCLIKIRRAYELNESCWFMTPETRDFLLTQRDALGQLAFKEEMSKGRLLGTPYAVMNSFPECLKRNKVAGLWGEIYIVDFENLILINPRLGCY
jgi:hypothetical protein